MFWLYLRKGPDSWIWRQGRLGGGMLFINCYLQTDVVPGGLFKIHPNVGMVVTDTDLLCVFLMASKTGHFLGVCNLIIIGFLELSDVNSSVYQLYQVTAARQCRSGGEQMLNEGPIIWSISIALHTSCDNWTETCQRYSIMPFPKYL